MQIYSPSGFLVQVSLSFVHLGGSSSQGFLVGPGGLYAALILDDLGIPYQILEAQDRVGGRLFTYTFPNSTGAPFNYYDVGAMRFPDIPVMRRLFNLFNYPPLNVGVETPLASLLQKYYFQAAGGNGFLSYNGVTIRANNPDPNPFKSEAVIKDVSRHAADAYINAGVENILHDALDGFITALQKDVETGSDEGWKKLMEFDAYSTRSYLSLVYKPSAAFQATLPPDLQLPDSPLSMDVVNWCETFDKSTGWYDRSLSETVLEAVAFGNGDKDTPWYCLEFVHCYLFLKGVP